MEGKGRRDKKGQVGIFRWEYSVTHRCHSVAHRNLQGRFKEMDQGRFKEMDCRVGESG